jgi:hypothetical protein
MWGFCAARQKFNSSAKTTVARNHFVSLKSCVTQIRNTCLMCTYVRPVHPGSVGFNISAELVAKLTPAKIRLHARVAGTNRSNYTIFCLLHVRSRITPRKSACGKVFPKALLELAFEVGEAMFEPPLFVTGSRVVQGAVRL